MKELYEAPEMNLISYIPAENLAFAFGFEDLLQGKPTMRGATEESDDIGLDL